MVGRLPQMAALQSQHPFLFYPSSLLAFLPEVFRNSRSTLCIIKSRHPPENFHLFILFFSRFINPISQSAAHFPSTSIATIHTGSDPASIYTSIPMKLATERGQYVYESELNQTELLKE